MIAERLAVIACDHDDGVARGGSDQATDLPIDESDLAVIRLLAANFARRSPGGSYGSCASKRCTHRKLGAPRRSRALLPSHASARDVTSSPRRSIVR